ncbi:pre-toxin TG domain-containing protein [Bacillus cereus group sp. BfR-BA-01380]|uniref:pre-toxin TG domain-containing protein n=1 Tax=Bacillus cereus group sp. BfR-BA-01380 TaxID=2920324 RepID=UPI0037BFB5CA
MQIAQKFRQADEEHKGEQKKEKLQEPHKKEKEKEKSWLDKAWTETKEFLGINDAIRAITGKDPETGKTLSTKDRWIAAGWTAINFIPVGKVVGLLGKGIKFAGKFVGKAVIKATKPIAEGVTMIASKAKSFVQKLGDALHKGKTVVKTTFLEADKKVQAAIKTLMEYKWIPGTGKAYAIPGCGSVRDAGSLKDVYQFMKETGEKIVGSGGKGASEAKLSKVIKNSDIPNMKRQEIIDSIPDNWKVSDNNGFAHIRDENGVIRMRIDPPDKVTKYDHVHIYDKNGNALDINGNIVDRKSPDAHIPYKK